jgi:hypothetical protein
MTASPPPSDKIGLFYLAGKAGLSGIGVAFHIGVGVFGTFAVRELLELRDNGPLRPLLFGLFRARHAIAEAIRLRGHQRGARGAHVRT